MVLSVGCDGRALALSSLLCSHLPARRVPAVSEREGTGASHRVPQVAQDSYGPTCSCVEGRARRSVSRSNRNDSNPAVTGRSGVGARGRSNVDLLPGGRGWGASDRNLSSETGHEGLVS